MAMMIISRNTSLKTQSPSSYRVPQLTPEPRNGHRNILRLVTHTDVGSAPIVIRKRPVIIGLVLRNRPAGVGRVVPILIDYREGGIAHASDLFPLEEGYSGEYS